MKRPDFQEYVEAAGGEVSYYNENGRWRYVCARGEGCLKPSLEAAQAEVREMAGEQAEAKCLFL